MPAVVTDIYESRLELVGASRFISGLVTAATAAGVLDGKLTAVERRNISLGISFGAIGVGIAATLARAVQEAGKFQLIEVGFKGILGSATKAHARLQQLQQFAASTPFRFEDVAATAKQLTAMGFDAAEVIPIMRDLGDTVAALGLGNDALNRIIFNFGQIKTLGKVTMREMRDFAMNGIPVFEILKEEMGLTHAQLKDIGNAGLDANKALDALRRGMQKRYGGQMSEQSKLLEGRLNKLRDAAQITMVAFGKPWIDPTIKVLEGSKEVLEQFNKLPDSVKNVASIVVGAGALALTLLAVKLMWNAYQSKKLTNQLIQQAAAHYLAANAANSQAAALQKLGQAQGQAGGVGGVGGMAGSGGAPTGTGTGVAGAGSAAYQAAQRNKAAGPGRIAAARKAASTATAAAATASAKVPVAAANVRKAVATANAAAAAAAADPGDAIKQANLQVANARAAAARVAHSNAVSKASAAAATASAAINKVPQVVAANTATVMGGIGPSLTPAAPAPVSAVASGGVKAAARGAMGKAAGFIGSPKGAIAAILAEIALQFVPDGGAVGVAKHIVQGALAGGSVGGLIGTIFPVIGNVAGAAIGAILGGGGAAFGEYKSAEAAKKAAKDAVPVAPQGKPLGNTDTSEDHLKRIVKLLEDLNAKESPIGYGKVSRYDQFRRAGNAMR